MCCADDGKDGGIGKDHGGDGKHDGDGKGHGGDCGTKCPKYEVKNPCGNYCEPTCKKPNPKNCPQVSSLNNFLFYIFSILNLKKKY